MLEETGAGIAMIGDPLQAAPVGHVAAELDAGGHVSHVASTDAAHDAMVGAWFEGSVAASG